MNYEGQICRPPVERSSFMLPVAVGCSYNRCKFCTLFKHLSYRLLPLEQVESELKRVRDLGGNPKQVFLGDGNAFAMDTERLLTILGLVRQYFPACTMVNLDATVTDISRKTDEDLRRLAIAGLRRLYIGIESGLPDVLKFMEKDHGQEEAYREIERLQRSGLVYCAHFMTGIAGRGRGKENAERLADFFNKTCPERVINFSLFLNRSAPLYKDIQSGTFEPADELENLREARRIVELIDTDLHYDGFHDAIRFRVWGHLPRDKDKLLWRLDEKIDEYSKKEAHYAFDVQMRPVIDQNAHLAERQSRKTAYLKSKQLRQRGGRERLPRQTVYF